MPAAPLPGDSSTLTLTTTSGTSEGSTDIVLSADDGERTPAAEATVVVEGLDVEGAVVNAYGRPFPTLVSIGGREPVPTGSDGTFSIAGVAVPYDLTVLDSAGTWAHRFVGLRTATPEALPWEATEGVAPASTATVTGTLPSVPTADHIAVVSVEGHEVAVAGSTIVNDNSADGGFDVTARWSGPSDVEATVRTVLYEIDPQGVPTGVVSTGSAEASLSPSPATPIDVGEIAWTPAEEMTFDVAVSLPTGFDLEELDVVTNLPGGLASLPLPNFMNASPPLVLPAPAIDGAGYTAYAEATSGNGRSFGWVTGLEPEVGVPRDVLLELPAPPARLEPAIGATASAGTTFAVAGPDDLAHLFLFLPLDPDAADSPPRLYVSTMAEEMTLPDFSSLDTALALPSGAGYEWAALSASGIEDADALVEGHGIVKGYLGVSSAFGGSGGGPEEDGSFFVGPAGSFVVP